MSRRTPMLLVIALALALTLPACGSRVADTSAGPTSDVGVSSPAIVSAPSTTAPLSVVTTDSAAPGDLSDFCTKSKLIDLSNVSAFEAYDTNSAVKLVFTFDKIQKAAPAALTAAFKDMRPLVEELNQKVKSGLVHDHDSLKAWLLAMNTTNPAGLEQWVRGQATVVPFIKSHCP